jgi:hypothetical protein
LPQRFTPPASASPHQAPSSFFAGLQEEVVTKKEDALSTSTLLPALLYQRFNTSASLAALCYQRFNNSASLVALLYQCYATALYYQRFPFPVTAQAEKTP